jgi:hypothetical protein
MHSASDFPILAVKLSVISQSSSAILKSSYEVNLYPSTRAVAVSVAMTGMVVEADMFLVMRMSLRDCDTVLIFYLRGFMSTTSGSGGS